MSLTYELDKTAENFRCGILASKISALLDRPAGGVITPIDQKDVRAALEAIQEILSGAQTLSSGRSVGGATPQSIRSLRIALNPLERMQQDGTSEDLVALLRSIERGLSSLSARNSIPEQNDDLRKAKAFFGIVADSVLSSFQTMPGLSAHTFDA